MSKKPESGQVEIVKVDTKDVELVEHNSFAMNNGSFGKEIGMAVLEGVIKEAGPAVTKVFTDKLNDNREQVKKIRENKILMLQREYENLMKNIQTEEAKENYNQERIDKWYERVDRIKQELDNMEEKADRFSKGLLISIKEFLSSKSRNK